MQRFAMLDSSGKPRRLMTGTLTHPNALPVEYPEIRQDRDSYQITQKPIQEWEVKDDKVIVTYNVEKYALDREKEKRKSLVRGQRKKVETQGVEVSGIPVRTDRKSQERISNLVTSLGVDLDVNVFDFEAYPGYWVSIDEATVKAIGKAVAQHVQKCFTRCRELHEQIADAKDMPELRKINIASGW